MKKSNRLITCAFFLVLPLTGCLWMEDRCEILPPINDYALDGRLDKVKEYIISNGNPNVTDANGNTPLMMTVVGDYIDIVKYLLKHGANPWIKNKIGETALEIAKRGFPHESVKILKDYMQHHPESEYK